MASEYILLQYPHTKMTFSLNTLGIDEIIWEIKTPLHEFIFDNSWELVIYHDGANLNIARRRK